jgi:hypothetical protein
MIRTNQKDAGFWNFWFVTPSSFNWYQTEKLVRKFTEPAAYSVLKSYLINRNHDMAGGMHGLATPKILLLECG